MRLFPRLLLGRQAAIHAEHLPADKLRRIAEVKNRAGISLPIADPEGIGGPGGQVGGLQGSLPCTAVVAVFSVLTRLQRT